MEKKFEAVSFQRKMRERLSRQYTANREKFLKDLQEQFGPSAKKKDEKEPHLTHR